MANSLALGITIGATLKGGFNNVLGGAKTKLSQLGGEIKSIGAQRGLIERFEKDQSALEKARLDLSAVSKQANRLKLALRKDPDNAGLAKELANTRQKAQRLSAAIEKQKAKLRESDRALGKAGLSVKDLGGQYNRLGRTLDQTRSRYNRLELVMGRKSAAKARLKDLGGQIAAVAGIAYSAAKVLGEAMDFESAMADVRKVVDFKTPDGLMRLGSTLKQMSLEIPISASGLASIAASGGQLGVAAADLPAFTETVAKMSTAFDMLPDEAGDAMAKLANIYQIPIGEMTTLGDAINHLSDNTAAKARDIVPVLARAGGTARQFGLSAVQVAALGDAFVALGKPPEVAGTAINAMLSKLQTAGHQGEKFQAALRDMGMSAEELESAIAEDAQGALTKFFEVLSGFEGGERAGILTDLFGLEYADDISLLVGSLDQYHKALSLVGDKSDFAGSMTREFENRCATTHHQLQLMKNSVSVLAVNLGSTLLPAVNKVLKPLTGLIAWTGDMIERFPWLGKLIGGLSVGIGVFVGGLVAVTAATWAWNVALLANPIGLTVAAICGAVALIITFWEPITEYFAELWSEIKLLFTDGVGHLTRIWELSPIGLMFTAGKKLYALGAGMRESLFGKSEEDQKAAEAAAGPPALDPGLLAPRQSNVSSATVNAPITINTHPGMDEKAVAEQVDKKLRAREAAARAKARGALYD